MLGVESMLDVFNERTEWIDKIGIIPSRCIERVDKVDGDKTLFHGCFDWHSAVHGHWALFRMDQSGSGIHHQRVIEVSQRFTPQKTSSVIKELEEFPKWELPYGRAWLLKLVIEYEKWGERIKVQLSKNWRHLGDTTADSLINYYVEGDSMRPPNILSNQYRNDCFSIIQLYDYYQHTNNRKKSTLDNYISKSFVENIPHIDPELDYEARAFLSPFWSWIYLLAKTQSDETLNELVKVKDMDEKILQPLPSQEIAPRKVHHLGMNWSRAWAIKSLARRLKEPMLEEAYHAHIKQGIKVHKRFVENNPEIEEKEAYYAYYHWVPQFALYAITD